MSSFRTLGRDLIAYGIMGALARSVHLLLLPVLTHEFSPSEYGKIEILATMAALLALLMSCSLENAVARLWFESERGNVRKQLISTVLAFVALIGCGIWLIIYALSSAIAQALLSNCGLGFYVQLSAVAGLLAGLSGIPQIILRMQRRIALYTIMNLTQTVSFVTLAFLFLYSFKMQLSAVFVAQACANGLALTIGLIAISNSVGMRLSLHQLRSALHFSLPLLPSVLIGWLNNQVGRISLLLLMGLSAVGVFGAAARIALIVGILVNVFQQAWTPLAISHIEQPAGRNEFYRRALNYYAASMTLVALVFVAYSKELLSILVPPQYSQGYVVIPWLVGAQILHGSGNITNVGMLVSKRTFGNSISAACGVVINISLTFTLVPFIGLWGATIGAFCASLAFTTSLCFFSIRTTTIRFDFGRLSGILGCYVLTCISVLSIDQFIPDSHRSLFFRSIVLLAAFSITICMAMDNHVRRICLELFARFKTACC